MHKIIRSNDLSTTQWSGGTTTQLAIWPPQADYASRNFTWRVSTARVDAPESEFTRLEGISRILMVLEGTLRLQHEENPEVVLNHFDQDRFEGDQRTVSYGRARDFNLMLRGCEGSVEALHIPSGQTLEIPHPSMNCISEVFYFLSPLQTESPGGATETLGESDVLVCRNRTEKLKFMNMTPVPAHVVRAVIRH